MSDQNEIYSKVVRAGKRTYFFDIKSTKGNDLYITLTESKKTFGEDGMDNYQKHKIFLYKEDFNRFQGGLDEAINYIKTDLMPDYDYEEFDRRQAEWEEKRAAMEAGTWVEPIEEGTTTETTTETSSEEEVGEKEIESEDDISW